MTAKPTPLPDEGGQLVVPPARVGRVEPLERPVDPTFHTFHQWEFEPGPDLPWLTTPPKYSKWNKNVTETLWLGQWRMLLPLMRRKGVSEIVIFGPHKIVVETNTGIHVTTLNFDPESPLPIGWNDGWHRPTPADLAGGLNTIQRNVKGTEVWQPGMEGKDVLVEAQLEDGSRLEALMPPCSTDSVIVFNIRRFAPIKLRREDFIAFNSFGPKAADVLEMAVVAGLTSLIGAGTGCGKTTLLEWMLSNIPLHQFPLTIEDTPELQIDHPLHRGLKTRERTQGLKSDAPFQEMGPADLLRASLRLRPDWIIVGEIRDSGANKSVADAFINACQSGHSGGATIHADDAYGAMIRLESMVRAARPSMKDESLRLNIGETVKLLVILSREKVIEWEPDGTRITRTLRRVKEIVEVLGSDGHNYHLHTLFSTRYREREFPTETGVHVEKHPELEFVGLPFFGLEMEDAGMDLPEWWYEAKLELLAKIPVVGRVAHKQRLLKL